MSAGISDLLGMSPCFVSSMVSCLTPGIHAVLKSTGSAFEGFVRDEYTTLDEVGDRIFSTSIDLKYTFVPVEIVPPGDEKKLEFSVVGEDVDGQVRGQGGVWDSVAVAERARKGTMEVFARDESASVQVRILLLSQSMTCVASPLRIIGDIVQDGAAIVSAERGRADGLVLVTK